MAAYELTRDGEALEPRFTTIQPGVLAGHVDESSATGLVEVFRTPIDAEWNLEEATHRQKGQEVALGPVESLVASGRSVEIQAEPGSIYDMFITEEDDDSMRRIVGGGRYAVTEAEDYQVPSMVTFDEARYLGAQALGLTEEQAETTTARVTPMTAWSNSGRLAIVGFDLGTPDHSSLSNPGVTVEHTGNVYFYHGMNAQETREAAGI